MYVRAITQRPNRRTAVRQAELHVSLHYRTIDRRDNFLS